MYLIVEVINEDITIDKADTLIEAQRYLKRAIEIILSKNKHITVHVDDAYMNAYIIQSHCNYIWKIINTDRLRNVKDIEKCL